ncbi:MAG TPA: Ig-like domain-containing protein, partial [Anaerolineae bacterium]|nr:Ig-like domain-containing protein [Anaerolineae bacterium]
INAAAFAYSAAPDPGGWAMVWNGAGTQVTLTHAPLAYNTHYTVTVTAAPDLAGNPLTAAPYAWDFTTLAVVDTTPPTVLSVSPADGATEVAVSAPIIITFSEAINAAAFAYSAAPDPGGWAMVWNGAGTQVTLTHAPLAYNTHYTVTVAAAPDLAGNPLTAAPYAWTFVTIPHAPNHLIFLPFVTRD